MNADGAKLKTFAPFEKSLSAGRNAGYRLAMAEALLRLTHMDTHVTFYHLNDERAFFEWLDRISCVKSYAGEGTLGLVVRLKRRPSANDLWELLALCHRYGANMRQLAKFETAKNRGWFHDPRKFWYQAVFE